MNPLTLVKRIQSINAKERSLGISEEASWHAKYRDSAYVFVGGIPYDLTEGDLLAVFSQYGEIVDVNLVRDKATGKSKGFAFVAYEDQRSTVLAVDNLNGAQIAGRTIRVDHVANYKKKQEEDEEEERQKREERGVCRQFQKGECKYGDSCRFSHDEQRAANTGWGAEEERKSRSTHGKFDERSESDKRSRDAPPSRVPEHKQNDAYDARSHRGKYATESGRRQYDVGSGDHDNGDKVRRSKYRDDQEKQIVQKRSSRFEPESRDLDDYDGRNDKRPERYDKDRERKRKGDSGRDGAGDEERAKRSSHHGDRDEEDHHGSRRAEDYRRSRR